MTNYELVLLEQGEDVALYERWPNLFTVAFGSQQYSMAMNRLLADLHKRDRVCSRITCEIECLHGCDLCGSDERLGVRASAPVRSGGRDQPRAVVAR